MIRIVADSSCDLPDELAATHNIEIVPLTIRFGNEEFVDRIGLTTGQFWDRLHASSVLPETAAPSAGAFRDTYTRLAEQGADGIVVVCLSSELSGTYQAAVIAAEQTSEIPVKVIDSRNVSMAMGFQVLEAARAAARGADLLEVAATAARTAEATNFLAVLDTLEYLQRGGRLGNTAAFFGSLLHIKPLITMENGVVAAAGRVRTRERALSALVDRIAELDVAELAILNAASSDIHDLRNRYSGATAPNLIAEIGPVVGTHTGPGVLGFAYRLR